MSDDKPNPEDGRTRDDSAVTRRGRGGLPMGQPFGIPIVVSPTWFVIAAVITLYFGNELNTTAVDELGRGRYLMSFLFAVLLYASVLLHELAHSVVAKHFGLPVRRIVIYFLGGVSEIEKEAETPWQEFAVAASGPGLSLVLGAGGWAVWAAMPKLTDQSTHLYIAVFYLVFSLWASNLVVGVFNLLPGLPLDGGRVLRAAVWAATKKPMAGTVAAAYVGRVMAVAMFFLVFGLQVGYGGGGGRHPWADVYAFAVAGFIGSFIWVGTSQALTVARLRDRIPRLRVRELTRRAVPVTAELPLAEAMRRAAAVGARGIVIVDGQGRPTALVHEASVLTVPLAQHPWVQVGTVSRALRPGLTLTTDLVGEEFLTALRSAPAPEYLVTEPDGAIYGVLAATDVEHAFLRG
ncbi:MAG TPA: site-2 protease family protein [Actinocrinis sp.]|nr:site-2 protease family protein [Actinocrinis sp.]